MVIEYSKYTTQYWHKKIQIEKSLLEINQLCQNVSREQS